MLASGWKIILFSSTLLIFQPPKCDGGGSRGRVSVAARQKSSSGFFCTKVPGKAKNQFIQIENSVKSEVGIYGVLVGETGEESSKNAKRSLTKSIEDGLQKKALHGSTFRSLNVEELLKSAFANAESDLRGTTCTIAIVEKDKMTVAYIGKSLGRLFLVVDVPESGRTKVSSCPGGNDKNEADTAIPEIETIHFSVRPPLYMILASNSLWNKMTIDDVRSVTEKCDVKNNIMNYANALVKKVRKSISDEDITALVVFFDIGQYTADP